VKVKLLGVDPSDGPDKSVSEVFSCYLCTGCGERTAVPGLKFPACRKCGASPKPSGSSSKDLIKYKLVSEGDGGEWIVKCLETGQVRRASEFGDVTPENTI